MQPVVKFTNVDDFLEELEFRPPDVDGVLRAVFVTEPSKTYPIGHYYVVATYLRSINAGAGAIVVELRQYCGQVFLSGPQGVADQQSEKVFNLAQGHRQRIEAAAAQLGLAVAGGIVQVAEAVAS